MRSILSLVFLLTFHSFAQKMPVGLIIQFNDEVTFEEKAELVAECNGLKPLKQGHELAGFDITLTEGEPGADYSGIQIDLEKNDWVKYTSVLYKTEKGAVGGDLSEIYLKPKSGVTIENYNAFLFSKGYGPIEAYHGLEGVYQIEGNKYASDIRETQKALMATGDFEIVAVNTFHSVLATTDDPYFENQWALENEGTELHFDGTAGADMQVPDAWSLTTGNPDLKIAVLDSGTDTNHVDLVGNLLPGFDATGGESKGYPNTTYSNDGHGTCTAGIIAALGDNTEGIAGVAYSCKVIPIKIFFYIEFGGDVIPFTSGEAGMDGMLWALNEANADVLSNSWGLRGTDIELLGIDTAMANMIISNGVSNGRDGLGTPMLFSAGNEYDPYSIWPASHPETISVGATSMCDELKSPTDCSPEGWWGSNHGDHLDVTAPGVKVLATDMTGGLGYNDFTDNNYSMFNGTSAACPNAAGVIALILSVDPSLTAADARAVLSVTAEKVGGYDYDTAGDFGMWSNEMGYGRVNAFEAVYYVNYYADLKESEKQLATVNYSNNQTILQLKTAELVEMTVYTTSGQVVARLTQSNSIVLDEYISVAGLYLIELRTANGNLETLKATIR